MDEKVKKSNEEDATSRLSNTETVNISNLNQLIQENISLEQENMYLTEMLKQALLLRCETNKNDQLIYNLMNFYSMTKPNNFSNC